MHDTHTQTHTYARTHFIKINIPHGEKCGAKQPRSYLSCMLSNSQRKTIVWVNIKKIIGGKIVAPEMIQRAKLRWGKRDRDEWRKRHEKRMKSANKRCLKHAILIMKYGAHVIMSNIYVYRTVLHCGK